VPGLPQLLISVRDEVEAELVSKFDIGILDVKEPDRGSLGASDPETLKSICENVPSGIPMGFSIGELAEWSDAQLEVEDSIGDRIGKDVLSHFQFVKVGLATMRNVQPGSNINQVINSGPTESGFLWQEKWELLFRSIPSSTSPVLVAYLDWRSCGAPLPDEVVDLGVRNDKCEFVLFDTFHKSNNLFESVSITELKRLIQMCKRENLKTVVAGSVDFSCMASVVSAQPDFVGVRGAVCAGGRKSQINAQRISKFVGRFQEFANL